MGVEDGEEGERSDFPHHDKTREGIVHVGVYCSHMFANPPPLDQTNLSFLVRLGEHHPGPRARMQLQMTVSTLVEKQSAGFQRFYFFFLSIISF